MNKAEISHNDYSHHPYDGSMDVVIASGRIENVYCQVYHNTHPLAHGITANALRKTMDRLLQAGTPTDYNYPLGSVSGPNDDGNRRFTFETPATPHEYTCGPFRVIRNTGPCKKPNPCFSHASHTALHKTVNGEEKRLYRALYNMTIVPEQLTIGPVHDNYAILEDGTGRYMAMCVTTKYEDTCLEFTYINSDEIPRLMAKITYPRGTVFTEQTLVSIAFGVLDIYEEQIHVHQNCRILPFEPDVL